jgi:hypothetical protein
VKERRPQADIGPHHLDSINRVIFHYLNSFQEIVPHSFNLDNLPKLNLDNLFSAEPFKRQTLQVCAINDLLIYAAQNHKDSRMTIINDLGYSKERKTLHCNLRDEILLMVCNISSYTLDDIENAANRDFGNKVAMKWTH